MWVTAFIFAVDVVAEDVLSVGAPDRLGAETLPIARRKFILKLACITKLE